MKHEPSLSPFSKKMAQLNPAIVSSGKSDMAGTFYPSTEYPSIATQPHPVPPPPSMGKAKFGFLL